MNHAPCKIEQAIRNKKKILLGTYLTYETSKWVGFWQIWVIPTAGQTAFSYTAENLGSLCCGHMQWQLFWKKIFSLQLMPLKSGRRHQTVLHFYCPFDLPGFAWSGAFKLEGPFHQWREKKQALWPIPFKACCLGAWFMIWNEEIWITK